MKRLPTLRPARCSTLTVVAHRLLTTTAIVVGALLPIAARADIIYTLNASNDTGTSGAGPYAQVDIHLVDATHATATFTGLGTFVFGEMGLDINATGFGISGLAFTLAPSSNQTPTYSVVMGGKVGGIGNFALDYATNPNGFTDAVTQASFTIHDTTGSWANEQSVLNNTVPEAAAHSFTATGGSFFSSGGPTSCTDSTGCGINLLSVAEPGSLALLGVGMLGLIWLPGRRPHG